MKKILIIFSVLTVITCLFNDVSIIFAKTAEEIEAEAHANSNASSEIIQEATGDYGISGQQITGTDSTTSSDSSGSTSGTGSDTSGLSVSIPDLKTYGPESWEKLATNVMEILIIIAGSAFVVMLFVGGAMYITAAGSEEQVGKATKVIKYAIIGVVVIALAWAVVEFIVNNSLNLNKTPAGSSTGTSTENDTDAVSTPSTSST